MTRHPVADLVLVLAAALIVADLLLASSPHPRAALVRFRVRRTFPHLSLGLVTLLVCAAGVAGIAGGLSVLTHS